MNRINFFKIGLVIIIVLIISLIILKLTKNVKSDNIENDESKNYMENTDGTKVNTSEDVKKTQNLDGIIVENSDLVYSKSETVLKTNVTNTTSVSRNISLKIYFCDEKGEIIEESFGYVGMVASDETRQLNSSITTDVSNTKSIRYEIVK
jgi:hypothetical protein